MGQSFSQEHEVYFYECDVNGRLTLPMLLNIAIYTSEKQCDYLGVGPAKVKSFGLGWVVTQYEINISRMPTSEERVFVKTEAVKYNKYFSYRDFWITDEEGKECAYIHSTFVLMNMETRKITRIPEELVAPFESEKTTKIERAQALPKITCEQQLMYRVRFSDIDMNQHVNNSKYFEWMTDVLGLEFLMTHTPKTIILKYEKEVEYGQEISSCWNLTENEDEIVSHHLICSSEINYAEALFTWEKLSK